MIGISRHRYLLFFKMVVPPPPPQIQPPALRSSYINKMNKLVDIQYRKQVLINALVQLQPQPLPQPPQQGQ